MKSKSSRMLDAFVAELSDTEQNYINYSYSFINGFKAESLIPNTTGCFDAMSNFTWIEVPTYQHNMSTTSDGLL